MSGVVVLHLALFLLGRFYGRNREVEFGAG